MPGVVLPPSNAPTWRAPSVMLLANGEPVEGVISAQVRSNNHYAADCFSVALAMDPDLPGSAPFWADSSDILLDLRFSLDGIAFIPLILGAVDSVVLDVITNTVRLQGRDLSAALIETRTQETFSNRTASEIAAILAGRHGLGASVTPTTTPVGRYYQNEHDRITLSQFSRATTEWDLLVFLARQEGFDVFVQGSTLYFQPAVGESGPAAFLQPGDLIDLRLRRSLTLAHDIEVTVKSWNSRLQSAFTQAVRASPSGAISSTPAQNYVFVRPNLTPDQALNFAQQRLTELTAHERVIELTMPGELALTPRSMITLYGTRSSFDQSYFIDAIERQIRGNGGFTQHVRAKSSSPRSQTTTPAVPIGSSSGS